jgi:Thiamine pyrophosphate-requiring enzymes [acetolactate synthase, pyruvate dehydrogenase (cytochrome), glyoxylate carboligase, phosphonopyruvate decarboxylase]
MRAADLMAKSLEKQGVERMFCVPGESYLALLDALHDTDIEVVACRHEGGAGFMAVADAKLTKKTWCSGHKPRAGSHQCVHCHSFGPAGCRAPGRHHWSGCP